MVIEEGPINLYMFHFLGGSGHEAYDYYVEKEGEPLLLIKEFSFKKIMTRLLSDYPSASKAVQEGRVNYGDTIYIIEKYNAKLGKQR